MYRLYHDAGLALRRRKRRRGVAVEREVLELPSARDQVWSMDFAMDALASGRRIKILTIVDDFTKEAIDVVPDQGISGQRVTSIQEQAGRSRGFPQAIRTDQGPEFAGKALDQRTYERGIDLKLIQPGKPRQNTYIASFNGRFRDECLNKYWFTSLNHAREEIAAWRRDYNEQRPHSAPDYRTPAEFAAANRQREVPEDREPDLAE